jgi:hypothetical protein
MSNAPESAPTQPSAAPASGGELRTTVNRRWMIKMVVFALVCAAFGTWGLVDAVSIYPNRGIEDASYKQREYLRAAQTAGSLDSASITDPAVRFDDLRERRERVQADYKRFLDAQSIAAQNTPQGQSAAREVRELAPAAVDAAALQWLESLRLVGRLKPEYTTVADARASLTQLEEKWKTREAPKPLAVYDLPLQWGFMAAGYLLAVYLLILIVRVKATVYRFDPATLTLTLQGGKGSISPSDLADVDKRKWDKFYVFLQFKDNRPELKLDLLRWEPLEAWVLQMESAAFPERAAEAAAKAAKEQTEGAEAAKATT